MAMKVAIDARDSASQLAYFIFACAIALGYAIPGLVFDVYWRKGTLTPLPHQFSKDRIRTVLWVFIFILLLFITYILRWDDLFNFGRSFIVPLLSVLVTEYFFSAVPKNRKL